jgi:hypothetical protein
MFTTKGRVGVMLHPHLPSHYFNRCGPLFEPFSPLRLRLEPEEVAQLRKLVKSLGSEPAANKSRRKR